MGAPSVTITFTELAASAIERSQRGIVVLGLVDESLGEDASSAFYTVTGITDIPDTLSETNQQYIKDALKGYTKAPKKVYVYVMSSTDGYADMMEYLNKIVWNWIAIPTVETDKKTGDIATWIKGRRDNDNKKVKAVLPNCGVDHEGIVNVTATAMNGEDEVTAEALCARIAGLIAGTPLDISCTYAPLAELTGCEYLSKEELDTAVDNGEFKLMWDGAKVKTVRGVTSLTTITQSKGNSFKKIKIVEAMDMIYDDIKTTLEDNYIGKYANSYDNKCLLITAINAYFATLETEGVLNEDADNYCEIDIDAQKTWLQSQGTDVSDMSDDEIKQADTGSYVFLRADLTILDAMEDITLEIAI